MRRGSIFNRFVILIITVIIVPMIIVYAGVSSILIENLHANYNDAVDLSASKASKSIGDAITSVVDTSVSIIGNIKVREYLTCDSNSSDFFELYLAAKSSIESYYLNSNYISHIQVMSIDETKSLSTDSKYTYRFTEEEKEGMLQTNGAWFWTHEENGRVAICRVMRDVTNTKEKIGFIKIVIREESIKRQFYVNDAQTRYAYAIMSIGDGDIVLTTDYNVNQSIHSVYEKNKKDIRIERKFVKQEGNRYLVFMRTGTKSFYLVVVAKDQTLYYGMMKYGTIVLFLILFLVTSGLCAVNYRKNIALPLDTLGKRMKRLNPGSEVPEQVSIKAEGEVKELVDSFNTMSAQLDYLYKTNYKNELKLRDAKLLILQSEMNPHFLYNVLDSIRWMIELEQKEAASNMVQELSDMLRLSLELSENSVIAFNRELEHAEKYISIEKYRFQNKIHFQMNIQKNLRNPLVTKFILQPLIENAVVHGISKYNGSGNVILSVYISDGELIYDIRDDGCGADPERIQEILDRRLIKQNCLEGFALENIQSRLQLRHGEDYGIEYRRRKEGGSIFIVRQPLVYQEGEVRNAEITDCR